LSSDTEMVSARRFLIYSGIFLLDRSMLEESNKLLFPSNYFNHFN
jgi:hypothetical protein